MRITYEEIIISANINGNRKYIYSQKTKSTRNSIASRILESEKKRRLRKQFKKRQNLLQIML